MIIFKKKVIFGENIVVSILIRQVYRDILLNCQYFFYVGFLQRYNKQSFKGLRMCGCICMREYCVSMYIERVYGQCEYVFILYVDMCVLFKYYFICECVFYVCMYIVCVDVCCVYMLCMCLCVFFILCVWIYVMCIRIF